MRAARITGNSDVPGENLYLTFSGNDPFAIDARDANYRLAGDVVPAPSTLLMVSSAVALAMGVWLRRFGSRPSTVAARPDKG